MSSECGMLSLIILLWSSGVQAQHSVTLSSQSLCAVTGSTVKISCKYTKPDSSSVREREWYQLQNSDGEERVLSKDPQYSARVSVSTEQNNCVLTVRGVTVKDSGVYNLRFRTSSSDWTSASSGVNLTVTELQVKVDPKSVEQKKVKLTCSSTCSPSENHHYRWYRNGEYKTSTDDSTILLDTTRLSDEGSYYCRLSSSVHRSPPVCVSVDSSQTICWSVTYQRTAICAVIGSSVYIHCYYTFPGNQKVTKSVWFIKKRAGAESVDVREDEEYQRRVQYIQSSQNYFSNSNYNTYIWYKNGQPLSDQYKTNTGQYLSVDIVGADNYSCSVRGHEELRSPAVYSPRNTRAVIVSSGETVEGDSVTLSCSSDANPPVLTYSWFKQRAAADAPLTTNQNYTITNISSQHSGLYYCTAHSQLGQHNSTPTRLDVLNTETVTDADNTAVKLAASAVGAVLLLMLFAAFLWMRRKRGAETDTDIQTPDPADPTYTALNPTTTSSDYDTLQHRTDSPSDTYAALNPETMCSDYDTLQGVTASHCEQQKILKRRISAVDYENVQRPPSQKPTQISL